ncbi:MAG: hypothetical protein K5648_06810 [Erysipelotrichaceae bacterium]|nr:hypothetical protein [Erysipelotrichaceae bacterium]
MRFSSGFKMFILLTLMLVLTYCFASHREIIDTASCALTKTYEIYLAVGETYPLSAERSVSAEDENIAAVEEGGLRGLSDGETKVQIGCETNSVRVSSLYTRPTLDMDKDYLPEERYTAEENYYLDTVLRYLIDKAGDQTRAGAVEAARFLTLRFPYKLNYFYENGRLVAGGYVTDGEGRYYHEGLYLSSAKLAGISASLAESGPWGTKIYEYSTEGYTPNGLDCSGFITWALYNAGFDCGDIGSGPSEDVPDLTDLGELVSIDEAKIEDLKCGDLTGLDGHIGMIIGMDGTRIYIAESYWVNDLQIRVYSYEEFLRKSEWEYCILMDEYYRQDGNYTAMWS